jgi:hypothetical protein
MNALRISAHSMSVLEQYSERRYLDRLASLVAGLTDGGETEKEILAECRELAARARANGFTTEFEVAAYVACSFAEGANFGKLPQYQNVFESPSLPARAKADMLLMILEHSSRSGSREEDSVAEQEETREQG